LFAGSGSLGLESLSRGAKEVVFNDMSKDSLAIVKKNLAALKISVNGEEAKVTQGDYLSCLSMQRGKFDLIFLDPPYRFDYGKTALEMIAQKGLLSENGIAAYERDRAFDGEVDGLEKYDERKYGKTYMTFFRLKKD
jgi:16S rRNA (guanine(966)-N(2))-methyltransferase RsmD